MNIVERKAGVTKSNLRPPSIRSGLLSLFAMNGVVVRVCIRWKQGVSDMVLEDGSRAEADRAEERRCRSDRYMSQHVREGVSPEYG